MFEMPKEEWLRTAIPEAIDNLKESLTFGDLFENPELDEEFEELKWLMAMRENYKRGI